MNKISRLRIALIVAILVLGSSVTAWAKGTMCPLKGGDHHRCSMGGYGMQSHNKSCMQMFMKKACFLHCQKEELGLSDEQVKKIEKLKMDALKEHIKSEAAIKVLKLDIMSALHEDTVDVAAINGLIDQKFDLKKAAAKKMIESYAELKGALTKEQLDKMKALKKQTHEMGSSKISSHAKMM